MSAKRLLAKYGPGLAVVGTALYLGWPPAEPLDLGDSAVRAKAVRWKKSDLEAPQRHELSITNPFREVLVAKPVAPVRTPTGEIVPAIPEGPTETELRAGLLIGGIGITSTTRWAIVNNRVCRVGDSIPVADLNDVQAVIEAIGSDHVVAKSSGRRLTIRRLDRRSREMLKHNKNHAVGAGEPSETKAANGDEADADDAQPGTLEALLPLLEQSA
ncbi:MAG: hypothetical protein AAFX06_07890 [Planctomycetota bacterium]